MSISGTDALGEPVHGSMYRYLWSNGPKEALEFPDYTFEKHYGRAIPSFPPREVLFNYLRGKIGGNGKVNGIKFATDTFYAKKKSLLSNTCTQLYSNKAGFNAPYHLSRDNGSQIGQLLNDFIHEWGAPESLTFDGAMAQTGRCTDFMKIIRKHNINWHVSQPLRPK